MFRSMGSLCDLGTLGKFENSLLCGDAPRAIRAALIERNAQRVLLIRDPMAVNANHLDGALRYAVDVGHHLSTYDISSTITPELVDLLGERAAADNYDCVVAVGGGAVIDAAKLIALRAANAGPIIRQLDRPMSPARIKLIAVPTTAGSGSEATHFAVLFDGLTKYSVAGESIRPQLAILCPQLTSTAPRRVALAAGLDVLAHSIESLWAKRSTPDSRELATTALQMVWQNFGLALVMRDQQAIQQMVLASHLAGHAIDQSYTTACHAFSYYLTARYQIPHGLAVAAMLPSMIEFNGTQPLDDPKDASRRKAWVASLLNVTGTTTIEQSAAAVARFIRQLGGAASIDELSLPANYCTATHVASVNRQRLYNNPCRIDPNQRVVLLSTRSSQPITPIVDNCLSLDPT